MTSPSDDQTANNLNNPDFDKTVTLIRCDKHGITYMETEGCPECAKEINPSPEKESD